MLRALLAIVAALAVLGSTLVDAEAFLERPGDHHEHGGLLDAPAGQGSHEHGDSDDHHPTPDSDCDHHVQHCCCGHVHAVVTWSSLTAGLEESSQRVRLHAATGWAGSFAEPLFHVPLA